MGYRKMLLICDELESGGRRKRRNLWSRCSVSPLKLDTYYMFVSKSVG